MTTERDKKRLHPVAIRLDDEMRDDLRAIAEAQHRPMANLIVAVLKEWLADQHAAGTIPKAKKNPPRK